MNSEQRRKEKRKRINNAQFKINDVVRIHHKYDDDHGIDTFSSRIVTGLKWDSQSKDLHYQLDHDNMLFPENYLIPDIKEEKRKMF